MTVYHKPSGFTKMTNAVLSWFASMGLLPARMVTVEVKGRRSGSLRSAVVNTVEVGGQKYLVSPRGQTEWVRNVRAAGGEAVIHHGKRQGVRLEEVPVEQRAPIIKAYLKENTMSTKSHFGVEPDAPIEEFERIAPDHPVFRVVPM